jgi:hypothetical protein
MTRCLPDPKGERENGHNWDEPLHKFKDGTINLNFYNNVIGYEAGAVVAGTVDIDLRDNFPHFEELVIEFVGLERSFLDQSGIASPEPFHREAKEIIKLQQVSRVFTGTGMQAG